MAKVNYFLSFASSILVGPLRLSCCSISPASLPKVKALLPQPSSLSLSCPHSHQISEKHQHFWLWPLGGPKGLICSPCPLSAREKTLPIGPSPALSGCLKILWDGGWGPCPLSHLLCPLLDAVLSCPSLTSLHWVFEARDPPELHIFVWLGASSPPACTGQPCQVLESPGRWVGLNRCCLHWACIQDFSAPSAGLNSASQPWWGVT